MSAKASDLTIDVETPRSWARRLTITVAAERVERERREIARSYAKRARMPGFRKGKVPTHVLERQFGAAIQREVVERVIGDAYREAVQREGLEPISQAEVEDVDLTQGGELTFKVEFDVQPQVELSRLGGFKVRRETQQVGDGDVDRVIEQIREERASWRTLEDGLPAAGDMVSVRITPLEEADAEARSYEFVLGEGRALEAVEQAIKSLAPGQSGEFDVDIQAGEEGEQPRDQRLRIELTKAMRPELPEADDEFARSLGEEFEDLGALRARIREDLEREAGAEAEQGVRRELLDRILEANTFDVPDSMVDRYLERVLPTREGADAERIAEMRAQARPAAEQAIKRMLVIDRVAEAESLRATQEEVDGRVEEIAARQQRGAGEVWSQLQKSGRLEALEEEITERKVLEFLKSKSTVE